MQPGLMPSQPGLRPSQPGLRLRQSARPKAQTASQAQSPGPEGGMDGQMYVHRENSPFHRTLSPIRAAALLPKRSRPIKRNRAREPLTN